MLAISVLPNIQIWIHSVDEDKVRQIAFGDEKAGAHYSIMLCG